MRLILRAATEIRVTDFGWEIEWRAVCIASHPRQRGNPMPNSIHRTTIALGDLSKAVAIAFLALAAAIAGPPPAMADDDDGGIRLVTQNMYVGSSFAALSCRTNAAAIACRGRDDLQQHPGHQAGRTRGRDGPRDRATPPRSGRAPGSSAAANRNRRARPRRCDRISCNRCSMSSPALDTATVRWRSFRDSMPRRRARSDSTSASPIRMPFWSARLGPMRSRCRTCKSSNSGSSFRCRPSSVPSRIRAGGRPST